MTDDILQQHTDTLGRIVAKSETSDSIEAGGIGLELIEAYNSLLNRLDEYRETVFRQTDENRHLKDKVQSLETQLSGLRMVCRSGV